MKTIRQFKSFGVVLGKIMPDIFALKFKNNYDLCMSFLRYQESYESPSRKFRGKCFTIIDFMEWYSKKYGKGAFTYTKDWGGFNLPGDIVIKLHKKGIVDYNKYDKFMKEIYHMCYEHSKKFYIIGVSEKCEALPHEIAHGFFYTNPVYRKEMKRLVAQLPQDIKKQLKSVLTEMGYAERVHIDEMQAYLATGLDTPFKKIKIGKTRQPFIKLFNNYYKEI